LISVYIILKRIFIYPLEDLLLNIKKIDIKHPEKIDLTEKYRAIGTEFFKFSEAITALNNKIVEKQEENNLIILNLENSNRKLNLLNELSYKLSTVFTLEYAVKIFAEGLYSIKKDREGKVDSLHINIFDIVNKKTVTSLIYSRDENKQGEDTDSGNSGKVTVTTDNINYEDYLSNCGLLKNGKNLNGSGMFYNCEFRGTAGSYTCFALKISDEVAGTVSVDSEDRGFFTQETTDLIKEIINIASPVFAKLILIETNKELAITDSLTGIYNRRFMYEFAKREIVRAYRNTTDLSIAILDIDRFKNINDNYGHHIGDVMLAEFTGDLKNVLMRKQDIITRYGGDEFVMILPDTDKENAVNLMEKLRIYIKDKIYNFEGNLNLNITASVGVSNLGSLPDGKNIKNNSDPDDILNRLLKIADDNLYIAKNMGRDRVAG
jgi:diguanylate cyclase (GGDEF)-like protein